MKADRVIDAALTSLAGDRHVYADAIRLVPKRPGLYAFYAEMAARVASSSVLVLLAWRHDFSLVLGLSLQVLRGPLLFERLARLLGQVLSRGLVGHECSFERKREPASWIHRTPSSGAYAGRRRRTGRRHGGHVSRAHAWPACGVRTRDGDVARRRCA